jgi:predicted alpha-1,2-mannosidase
MKSRLSRRAFLRNAALSSAALAAKRGWAKAAGASPTQTGKLTGMVDVFLGTGGHGHCYPGATVPFGMVQLSPDTGTSGWDHCSGYHRDDTSILGFSHTHLSGTGVGDMMDFLLMPSRGPVKVTPGDADAPGSGYRASFSHADEAARPGYYSVLLKETGIRAELTATCRAGLHRYSFPADASSHIVLDLAHGFASTDDDKPTKTGRCHVLSSELRVVGADTVTGGRRVSQWAPGRYIYCAMKFSKPFASATIFADEKPLAGASEASGTSLRCVLAYPLETADTILVKVGISAVSAEGALRNLDAEAPGWDFDGVRAAADAAWESELARATVESPNAEQKRTFYSAMYHSLVAPTTFFDVDGQYRGMDLKVRQLPAGGKNYSTYSLWDTYRALHPLLTLVQPDKVPELANCLVRMGEESPDGAPVWPLQGVETGCMIGYHSAVVLAEAHAKGIAGVDYARAYKLFRKRAMVDDYRGLPAYRLLGYVPCDEEWEAVSKTLEYSYDDWAVAHLAGAAGASEDRELLLKRSRNYKNVFDPSIQFMRGKLRSGAWADPFDPRGMGHFQKWRDFTESNSWEATFLNQHDVKEYMSLFGGEEGFVAKLDHLFNQSSELPPDAPPDIAGMVGQYAQGNEPDHHVAYLYAYAGQAWKTQARVRSLLTTFYRDAPDGLAGNEDCGQMSAWFLMSSLGLYAVDPVSGNYVFGSPLFDRATLDVGGGKKLTIRAIGNGPERPYVRSVTWKGAPYRKSWIRHADLAAGGALVFTMGAEPNKDFGAAAEDRPPSFV